jgi:hypothetical protein
MQEILPVLSPMEKDTSLRVLFAGNDLGLTNTI